MPGESQLRGHSPPFSATPWVDTKLEAQGDTRIADSEEETDINVLSDGSRWEETPDLWKMKIQVVRHVITYFLYFFEG